jgi:L-alanine-DL-glutamate epimerase-like enolase superfamily enzyme
LRITRIRATPVAVPYRTDEVWAFGRRSGLIALIVEVDTDEGLTGLGEAAAYPSADAVLGALRSMGPLVVGSDPLRIEQLIQRIDVVGTYHHTGFSSPAASALETACWDLLGKSCGKPVVSLFGGLFRDRVEFFHYVAAGSPDEVRAEGARAVRAGARTCYLKVGSDELDTDVERVAALRDGAGPAMGIRVDANEAWSAGAAVRAVRAMERYGLELVEQPVSGRNLPEMAYVRSRIDTPLLANEASWTRAAQFAVLRHGAADVISVDQQMDGGLLNLKRSAGMCAAAGVPVVKHSLGELGVAMAAAVHVIASTPNFRCANQGYGALLSDDIVGGGFAGPLENYTDCTLDVPEGAGLGVELDPEKMERYAELYAKSAADFTFHDSGTAGQAAGPAPALPKR